MTSRRTPGALRVELRPSRLLLVFLVLQHVAVAVAILMAGLPVAIAWASALLVLFSVFYQVYRLVADSCRLFAITYHHGRWHLEYRRGVLVGHLRARWRLPWVLGLSIELDGQRQSLLLLRDSCSADDFRRLQLWSGFVATTVSGVEDRV
ncbi:protein YgfX [Litorivivens sp.]|uniref:protein YgfX n=1 Tax=Litorivivens sp. TaxID=2020868 RepID=UPI0035628E9B